jgi:uncharacterized membrane protein YtjA (UPF0391 family)
VIARVPQSSSPAATWCRLEELGWTRSCFDYSQEGIAVLYYALTFLVIALIAALLGMSGVAGLASQVAWVLFAIGIILLIVNFITGNRPRSVV